jgi:hypothetical protein
VLVPEVGSSPVLVYVVVGALVVLRFAFRELRPRKMRLGRLFIVPIIFAVLALVLVAVALAAAPQAALHLALALAVALVLGFAIGSAVGHFTTLRLHERPEYVVVRGSAITAAIWLAAVALRVCVRFAVPSHDLADTLIANAALIVMLALALFFVRYRIFLLARLARREGISREMTAV